MRAKLGPPARLSPDEVREARRLYRPRLVTLMDVARHFQCSHSVIHKAVHGLPPYHRIKKEKPLAQNND